MSSLPSSFHRKHRARMSQNQPGVSNYFEKWVQVPGFTGSCPIFWLRTGFLPLADHSVSGRSCLPRKNRTLVSLRCTLTLRRLGGRHHGSAKPVVGRSPVVRSSKASNKRCPTPKVCNKCHASSNRCLTTSNNVCY